MTLKEYKRKRNFLKTPEPQQKRITTQKNKKRIFVIQKHAASHLHYDFRLQLGGILKSWAVPKGPSKDPQVKRLAMEVEDHPLSYATFSGVIPKGQYGAGTVEIWDKGTWEPLGNPRKDFQDGKLEFILHGKKLTGKWALVKMKGDQKGKPWLLIKMQETKKQSALKSSIKKIPSLLAEAKNAKAVKRLPIVWPELATLVDAAPSGENWLHELKYDGYRLLTYFQNGDILIRTRSGHDWTHKFPELVKQLKKLSLSNTVLDGEVVAIDDKGKISFQLLQNSLSEGNGKNLYYYIFDIPICLGFDIRQLELSKRKKILKTIFNDSLHGQKIKFSDFIEGSGKSVFDTACHIGMEGIISKRAESTYESIRSRNWLKIKCKNEQEFIIIGFTLSQKREFKALLLGYYDENAELHFAGHVGTGFSEITLTELRKKLLSLKRTEPLFSPLPSGVDRKRTVWVEPKLVAQIEFKEWTEEGILRQAVFLGLRTDKKAEEVKMEKVQSVSMVKKSNVNSKQVLTHENKILFPNKKITKGKLADYYLAVAKWMLPYIQDRPIMLLRCPEGLKQVCFFQKHYNNTLTKNIYPIKIKEKTKTDLFIYIQSTEGLLDLAQLSVLEIHSWGSNIKKIESPDQLIFDLDPAPDIAWPKLVEAARRLRKILADHDLVSFVKTSGKKGLHIVVPLIPKARWKKIKEFARDIVLQMEAAHPNDYIATMAKANRMKENFYGQALAKICGF